ncbi:MAG: hypothetical protein ACHP84_12935 [Caulobacterales bacterium]
MATADTGITRLESANAQAVLDRIVEAGLIERGMVAIISVSAIRARSGERWPRRREDVWTYVAKKCDEHLSFQDIHHRLNDVDFVVAMTAEHPAAVQAAALRILEEVLLFFVGAADGADLQIKTVTSLSAGVVGCSPVDPAAIPRAPVVMDTVQSPFRLGVDPAEERKRNPATFMSGKGEGLRVDFAVEHLVSLRHQVTAALRIEPTVSLVSTGVTIPGRAFGRFTDEEVAYLDHATLEYGALFMPNAGFSTQPALILPVSFRTMAGRKGRHALAMVAPGTPQALKTSVMVEFVDVDRGTPVSRLTEIAGLVSSLCRGAFVRLRPARDMLAAVRGYRPLGLTLDAADLGATHAQIATQMLAFGEQARGAAPALVIQGLPSEEFFQVAQVAGLTHASLRGQALTRQMDAA